MADVDFSFEGLDELKKAVQRNPAKVKSEVNLFLVRGMAGYKSIIRNSPWRMGESGGGAPQKSGKLMETHATEILPWQASIYPTAPYASYVHGLNGKTVNKKGVQLRPWLDYAFKQNSGNVELLQSKLLENIVNDLAS